MSTSLAINGMVASKNIVPSLIHSFDQFGANQEIGIGLAIHGHHGPQLFKPRLHRFVAQKPAQQAPFLTGNKHLQFSAFAGIGQGRINLIEKTSTNLILPRLSQGPDADLNSPAKVAVVLHGQFEDAAALRNVLLERGYRFNGETHDELIAHLLDATYQNDPTQAIQRVMSLMAGTFALGVLFMDQPDRVFAAQHGIPIFLKSDSEQTTWSTQLEMIPMQKKSTVQMLSEGMLLEVQTHGYKITNHHGLTMDK